MIREFFEFLGRHAPIRSGPVFYGISALILGYLLYVAVRGRRAPKRAGDRRDLDL